MADIQKINRICEVIALFFEKNVLVSKIPAKDLMSYFIRAGIFPANHKNGLPIRKILRDLDETNQLKLIPYVLPERNQASTNWYFIRLNRKPVTVDTFINIKETKSATASKSNRDEDYVIDLVDEILQQKGHRQHRFDFLLGDPGKDGRRAKLPVDVYYPSLKLVVEYREYQHSNAVKFFDKPDKITASGVHRGEQRKIYDQRRRDVLPEHGIRLVEFSYTSFNYGKNNRICRSMKDDKRIIMEILKPDKVL
jgi:hypothetical protein